MAKGGQSQADCYLEAGFSSANTASAARLANLPKVRDRINELISRKIEKEEITTAMALERAAVTKLAIVEELKSIGFARMDHFTKDNGGGERVIDFSELPDGDSKWAAVKEIVSEVYFEGRGDDAREVKKTRLTLHDKKSALMELARMHQMIVPVSIQTQNNQFNIYLDGEDARA